MKKHLGLKIALYVCVLVVFFSAVSTVGILCMHFEHKENGYYATNHFANHLEEAINAAIAAQQMNGEIEKKIPIKEEEVIYTLTSYEQVLKGNKINKNVEDEKINFFKAKQIDSNLESNFYCDGYNEGENLFSYYYTLSAQTNALMQENANKAFFSISKEDYINLLKKYVTFDREITDLNNKYSFQKDQNILTLCPKEESDSSFCLSLQSPDEMGEEDANFYEYEYSDSYIMSSKRLYFVKAMLDVTSQKELEKSIITSPFCSDERVLSYLALEEQMENHIDSDYYNPVLGTQINYVITKEVGDEIASYKKGKSEESITFYADTNSLDKASQEKVAAKKLMVPDIYQTLQDYGIKSMKVEIPTMSDWFNGFTLFKVCYELTNYLSLILLIGLFAFLCGVMLFVKIVKKDDTSQFTLFDKQYFEIRTMLYITICTILAVLFFMALAFVLEMVYEYRESLQILLLLFGLIVAWCILMLTVQYVLSIKRNLKYPSAKGHSICCNLFKKGKMLVLKGIHIFRNNVKFTMQFIILFSVFLVINFSGVLLGSPVLFFIALIVDLFIGYKIFQNRVALENICTGVKRIAEGDLSYQFENTEKLLEYQGLAESMNQIREGFEQAVEKSIRDERLKAELITNVSHDIKTPLTSIISYIDLIKRENITKEPLKGYVEVLDQKSQRLKHLIEDLVEASKAGTGNIELECTKLDMRQLVIQAVGEFEEQFQQKQLETVLDIGNDSVIVNVDGRRCYRILENLFSNVCKYSLPHTRVYVNLSRNGKEMELCIRNISEIPLNIDPQELTQRFVRGDKSRTKEGNGLGLSIAKSLTQLQNGKFEIVMDGDLFKVIIHFPCEQEENSDEN